MTAHKHIERAPDLDPGLVAGAMPGDLLAIKLYRLLEDKPEGDLLHVLNAIKARQRSAARESIAAPMSERECFVRASLQAALQALGRTPSRRAYEKWRAQQPQPSEFASDGLVKKVLGGWTAATESLGAPVADHSARRLISKGRAFSVIECREAIPLYTESTPPVRTPREWGGVSAAAMVVFDDGG